MELKMEQASVCDPERLEQRRGLGVQQDKSCVGMHRERRVQWRRSSDAGQIWVKEGAWHRLGRKKGEVRRTEKLRCFSCWVLAQKVKDFSWGVHDWKWWKEQERWAGRSAGFVHRLPAAQ